MPRYLVYENWQADNKAVVHVETCGHATEGHNRLNDHGAPNDRWYGYFQTKGEAIAFASLIPNRNLRLCSICMRTTKESL